MSYPYYLFIALRHLRSRKKNIGVSFNTAISIGGVAVGVMALLVVLSVMTGFHEDLQRKILGVNPHVVILSFKGGIDDVKPLIEKSSKHPIVEASAPFVYAQAMLSSGKKAHGVVVRGVDIHAEKSTTEIFRYIKFGSIEWITEPNWIVLGRELSLQLGVLVGDTVNIISPVIEPSPLGMIPRIKQFKVSAIFDIGMFEYDTNLALIDISEASRFFKTDGKVTGIELRLSDIYQADRVREDLNKTLGFPYYARDWMQMNKNLFSALKLEKFAMFVILILIVLVASFNIVSTLMMNVMQKQKEIAILKAMGAADKGIMLIFMFQGLIIGLIGTTIGVIAGWWLGIILDRYELIKLPADIYYLSKLPVKMKLFDFAVVSISAIIISFLSTLYPAYYAARMQPVESLRYE